jgi:hypothetical protein
VHASICVLAFLSDATTLHVSRAVHGVHACVGMARRRARWRCPRRLQQHGDVSSKAASGRTCATRITDVLYISA